MISLKNLKTAFKISKNELKEQYLESKLSWIWLILEPIIILAVMLLAFGNRLGTNIEFYAVYLIIGIITLRLFLINSRESSNAFNARTAKLIEKTKPYTIIESIFIKNFFIHLIEIVILAIVMVIYSSSLLPLIFYPLIFIVYGIFIYGFSLLIAVSSLYHKDTIPIWKIISRSLWFLSPIFYFLEPGLLLKINEFNPIYYFLTIIRTVLIEKAIPETSLIITTLLISIGFLILGSLIYRKSEPNILEKTKQQVKAKRTRASLFSESLD